MYTPRTFMITIFINIGILVWKRMRVALSINMFKLLNRRILRIWAKKSAARCMWFLVLHGKLNGITYDKKMKVHKIVGSDNFGSSTSENTFVVFLCKIKTEY
jgi:hypothetical protein